MKLPPLRRWAVCRPKNIKHVSESLARADMFHAHDKHAALFWLGPTCSILLLYTLKWKRTPARAVHIPIWATFAKKCPTVCWNYTAFRKNYTTITRDLFPLMFNVFVLREEQRSGGRSSQSTAEWKRLQTLRFQQFHIYCKQSCVK